MDEDQVPSLGPGRTYIVSEGSHSLVLYLERSRPPFEDLLESVSSGFGSSTQLSSNVMIFSATRGVVIGDCFMELCNAAARDAQSCCPIFPMFIPQGALMEQSGKLLCIPSYVDVNIRLLLLTTIHSLHRMSSSLNFLHLLPLSKPSLCLTTLFSL